MADRNRSVELFQHFTTVAHALTIAMACAVGLSTACHVPGDSSHLWLTQMDLCNPMPKSQLCQHANVCGITSLSVWQIFVFVTPRATTCDCASRSDTIAAICHCY